MRRILLSVILLSWTWAVCAQEKSERNKFWSLWSYDANVVQEFKTSSNAYLNIFRDNYTYTGGNFRLNFRVLKNVDVWWQFSFYIDNGCKRSLPGDLWFKKLQPENYYISEESYDYFLVRMEHIFGVKTRFKISKDWYIANTIGMGTTDQPDMLRILSLKEKGSTRMLNVRYELNRFDDHFPGNAPVLLLSTEFERRIGRGVGWMIGIHYKQVLRRNDLGAVVTDVYSGREIERLKLEDKKFGYIGITTGFIFGRGYRYVAGDNY